MSLTTLLQRGQLLQLVLLSFAKVAGSTSGSRVRVQRLFSSKSVVCGSLRHVVQISQLHVGQRTVGRY
jgi:hypothetical protein